jgi:hypothetical protein
MCNLRIQKLAGIGGNILPPQTVTGTIFKSSSQMVIERRRRWLDRFKKVPRYKQIRRK